MENHPRQVPGSKEIKMVKKIQKKWLVQKISTVILNTTSKRTQKEMREEQKHLELQQKHKKWQLNKNRY